MLSELWDQLLAPAGLAFDEASAENPIQLSDNLKAYVTLRGSTIRVPYKRLSTGIRNFMFRLGHIKTLYFGRSIRSGFLFVDEPENSLHPDFLYDLVSIYERVIENTQTFWATHSPIVATQFEPSERVILGFDEATGAVHAARGSSPEGDDPNDMLRKEFRVRSVYGKQGLAMWEQYLRLRREMQVTADPEEKHRLVGEYLRLGMEYNFPGSDQSAP